MTVTRQLVAWIVVAGLVAGCGLFTGGDERVVTGSGRVTSETRAVVGIARVALEGMGEVVIQEGAAASLTIEAEDNILPLITSAVAGGTLRLGFERATWRDTIRPTEPIRFVLTVRALEAFELSGSGSLYASSLHTDDLTLHITGAGDVTIEQLESSRLVVRIDGASDVNLAGTVGEQVVEISGDGQYQAGDLDSQATTVTISGSGDVVVWARSELSMNISGSGTVSYWGDPTVSRRDISGAGDINPMGVK
jgi:hypothetical protein